MTGITNRDPRAEGENQQRVEKRKPQLPDIEAVNRPRKDHASDKDRERDLDERGRVSETGAGQGTEHSGH